MARKMPGTQIDAVTVCYEYLESILKNAPEQTTADGVTRMGAVIGPLVDVFLRPVCRL
jgi:hypothetical protein